MAANETAALVVALSAQVTKFQKDMDQATSIADKSVKKIESRFAAANQTIGRELEGFASTASSRLGTAGAVLGSLGPVGIGVAVGLGTLALAFQLVSDKVDAFAEKARRLKEVSETTGLTITQLRLLGAAGSRVGLDLEQTSSFVERLTTAVEDLRTKGSGPLFDALLRIDAGLVRQVADAKDVATAIDIVAKAYKGLDDQFQRNQLVASIAGRRNVEGGRLLEGVADAGGLEGLKKAADEAGIKIDELATQRIANLKKEIDEIKRRTDNIWGETFSGPVLSAQKSSAEFWERIALAVQKAAQFVSTASQSTQIAASPFGRRFRGVDQPFVAGADVDPSALTAEKLKRFGEQRLRELGGGLTEPPAASIPSTTSSDSRRQSAAVELELMRKWTSLLGDAITPSEQLKLKILELNVAQEQGGVSDSVRSRALEAFKRAQEAAAVATKQNLGIASEEEIAQTRIAVLRKAIADGIVTDAAKIVEAERLIAHEAKASAEALQVRRSTLPQLTQSLIDYGNTAKQVDQFATSALSSTENAFADAVTGAKTFQAAMKDLVNSIERDLTKLLFRQAIGGLFGATGADSFLGGLFGGKRAAGGPVEAGRAYLVNENTPNSEIFVPSAPGVIVPNSVSRSIPAGQPNVNVKIVNPPGYQARVQDDAESSGGRSPMVVFDEIMSGNLARLGSKTNQALMANFNLGPRLRRRG